MTAGYARALARLSFLTFALSCAAAFQASAAEMKGYGEVCSGKNQICFWLKPVVALPKGWVEDEEWSHRYHSLFLFENGDTSKDKPVIYIHAEGHLKEQTLEQFIELYQTGWKKSQKDRTIERLADFERKNKPTFKVFLYGNPSNPEQAFELTAFTEDVDTAHPGRTYFFEAVLIAPSKEELERTKAAFYELLANL